MRFAIDNENGMLIDLSWTDNAHSIYEIGKIRPKSRSSKPAYSCPECSEPVHVCSRAVPHGHSYYFRHKKRIRGEADCPLRVLDAGENRSTIHDGVQEGSYHLNAKYALAATLGRLPGWEVISIDSKQVASDDGGERRQPDIHARLKGRDLAIEIQGHSETVEVLAGRKNFYAAKGWPLIWISIERMNGDLVRQVHKDIAMMQRGCLFDLSAEAMANSLKSGELNLDVYYAYPVLFGTLIIDQWREERATISEIILKPGEAYRHDCLALHEKLKRQADDLVLEAACKRANRIAMNESVRSAKEFHWIMNEYWTGNSRPYSEVKDALETVFTRCFQLRMENLRAEIVRACARGYHPRYLVDNQVEQEFTRLQNKHSRLGVGLGRLDYHEISRLLIILGLPLREPTPNMAHNEANTLYRYLDSKMDSIAGSVTSAALDALELSAMKQNILSRPKTRTQSRKTAMIANWPAAPEYSRFVDWFARGKIAIRENYPSMSLREARKFMLARWLEKGAAG